MFCSSLNAFGDAHGVTPIDENTPPNAASPAAQVFLEAENKLAALETGSLKVCNFRTGTIYGPGREHRNELRHIAGKAIPFEASPMPAMLIHRDDVVRAIAFAIDKRLSGIYNLFNDISDNSSGCRRCGVNFARWAAGDAAPKKSKGKGAKGPEKKRVDDKGRGPARERSRFRPWRWAAALGLVAFLKP